MVFSDSAGRLREVGSTKGRNPATVADRRQRIVEARIEELHANGFARVKVESVAARAGIDKKTLYDHIEKKEDLLLLVFGQYLPRLLGEIQPAKKTSDDPYHQLYAMLVVHTRIISESPHFVLFHYRELRYLDREDRRSVLTLVERDPPCLAIGLR